MGPASARRPPWVTGGMTPRSPWEKCRRRHAGPKAGEHGSIPAPNLQRRTCGTSSVGRAPASQAGGDGFETRVPLQPLLLPRPEKVPSRGARPCITLETQPGNVSVEEHVRAEVAVVCTQSIRMVTGRECHSRDRGSIPRDCSGGLTLRLWPLQREVTHRLLCLCPDR